MTLTRELLSITAAITTLLASRAGAQDLTRKYEAYGPEVVEAVVDEVRRSCVLPQDFLLLRRLAYVESFDGTDVKTFRPGFFGGIWQVTQAMYDQTKSSPYLQQMRSDINSHLQIDWQSTSWQDLRKPLYSGLAAALYVVDTLRTKPHPVGIDEQQTFWASSYHHHQHGQGHNDLTQFSSLAHLMELGCHGQADLDIAFVLDTSSSISTEDFIDAKNFVTNTTSIFDLDSGRARVALITFSDSATVRMNWGDVRTHAALNLAVTSLTYESGGTETAKALNLANQLFSGQARRSAVKVLVLVTDGRSHDAIDTAAAASNLARENPAILVLAMGVGDQVDEDELHRIATPPACKHTFHVDTYGQIDAVREEIQRITCRAPLALHVNETVQCQLGQCPPYVVQVPPNSTVMVQVTSTCEKGATLYSSSKIPYPVASNSDTSITVTAAGGSAPLSVFYVPTSGSSPALYYINTDQTSVPSTPQCNVTLSVLLNEVQVVCIDAGHQRPCTVTDIANFEQTSGSQLCP